MVNGTLDLRPYVGNNSSTITVYGGLTLNGTAYVGSEDNSVSGKISFEGGSQALTGSGVVQFGGNGGNRLEVVGTGAVLTIDSGITVQGKSGNIGGSGTNAGLVNYGAIGSSVSGGSLGLYGV